MVGVPGAAGITPVGLLVAEVAEVLQLISVLGIHALTLGMPTMIEEMDRAANPKAGKAG